MIATIRDPLLDIMCHFDSLELLKGIIELPCALAAASVRVEPGEEAGRDSVEARVNR